MTWLPLTASGVEFDVAIGAETWLFPESGDDGQNQLFAAASVEPEFQTEWNGGDDRLNFEGFLRLDANDSKRTHDDIRALYWHRLGPNWDLKVGLDRVFWGVTEFQNPADIVNQIDLVESPDGDERLGQPMVRWTYLGNHGTLDVLALPWFRERTFAGSDGRFRPTPAVDGDAARYESGAEEHRLDAAIRYRFTWQQTDWAISHFSGTSRDPILQPVIDAGGVSVVPFYAVIDQTAFTAQSARGSWLWKFEWATRSGPPARYTAMTGGFEVTSYNLFDTGYDVGWITEYLFDDRKASQTAAFEHDWFFGARLQLNDIEASEVLFGLAWDPASSERVYSVEGSTRFMSDYSLDVEARIFAGSEKPGLLPSRSNKLGYLRRDDYLKVAVTRYF